MSIQVKGVRELTRSLQQFGVQVTDLKDAFQKVGRTVEREVRDLIPVRTGALQSSVRSARQKSKAVVRAGSAKANYAGHQNYGFKGVPGKQFMQQALQNKQGEAVQTFEVEIRSLIRKYDLN